MEQEPTYTAFAGEKRIASGPLSTLLPQLKERIDRGESEPLLIFENHSGRQVDFDLRGSVEQILRRNLPEQRSGPGRPKLGVVSREVSLLPRQWEWLEEQPNGASAALRRLVDEARKRDPDRQRARQAMDATARFMSALAGNLPGFEEASRALYAADLERFRKLTQKWPRDIRQHARQMAADAFWVAKVG